MARKQDVWITLLGTHTPLEQFHTTRRNSLRKMPFHNHKKAFNLEKETKIINPHKMELQTSTKEEYQGK
jgi:hypothetical protein